MWRGYIDVMACCVLCGGLRLFDEPEYCLACAFSARAALSPIGLEDYLLRDYAEAKHLVRLGIPESGTLERFLEMLSCVLFEPGRFDKPIDEFRGFMMELAAAQRAARRIIESYRVTRGLEVEEDINSEVRKILGDWRRLLVNKDKRRKSALDLLYIHLQSVFRGLTVGDFKRELCMRMNLNPDVMRITMKGKALPDSERLESIRLDEGAVFFQLHGLWGVS